ncbi:MAG TPA: tetratricopeptide repeat protein [Blastocatellia bacterium]|nr:tetratricopeptide repeat protein [Blastocatellia bacterium]
MIDIRSCLYAIAVLTAIFNASARSQGRIAPRAVAHFNRAEQLDALGDSQAEQEYRLAIKDNGGVYPDASVKLSRFLEAHLRFGSAITFLRQYIRETPELEHGDDLKEADNLAQIVRLKSLLSENGRLSSADFFLLVDLVRTYASKDAALAYAEQALDLYPASATSNLLVASLLPSGQEERQLRLLNRAVELEPGNPKAHCSLAYCYLFPLRNRESAIKEFRTALALTHDDYADAWNGLGEALLLTGSKKAAIEAFKSYLRTRKEPSQYDDEVRRKIRALEDSPQN